MALQGRRAKGREALSLTVPPLRLFPAGGPIAEAISHAVSRQSGYVASITRRPAELARLLWDLSKTALSIRLWQPWVAAGLDADPVLARLIDERPDFDPQA